MVETDLTREEQIEIELSDKFYHDYFHSFLSQLQLLDDVNDFEHDDRFFGNEDGKHIQYKYKVGDNGETFLYSRDEHRAYEFLIEFDKVDTAYGIYYGCRGYICEGELAEEIKIMDHEWKRLQGEICRILNNTFVDKDFSRRFKPTNNAWDRTYWPFWITLENDEDIVGVAARATRLIGNVYKKYFSIVSKFYKPMPMKSKKFSTLRTAFTYDQYRNVLSCVQRDYGEEARQAFKYFVENGQKKKYNLFHLDKDYEFALRFETRWTNLGVAALIGRFCVDHDITAPVNGRNVIPWDLFDTLFLSAEGKPLGSIKQSYLSAKDNDDLDENARIVLEQMRF